MAGTEDVVQDSEAHSAADGEDAPVHFRDRRIHLRWPETEEDDDSDVDNRVAVDEGTPNPRAAEWAPDEPRAGYINNFVVAVIAQGDVATDPAYEEQN